MSRMFDALENARSLAVQKQAFLPGLSQGRGIATNLPLWRLWQAVETRLADKRRKIVQISACTEGEEDPSVALGLARLAGAVMAGSPLGGGVLLLKTNESQSRVDDDGVVMLGPLPGKNGDARALNPHFLAEYWRKLSEQDELILLDTPSLTASPVAQALASTVDGVILIIQAERTRSHVAAEAKRLLEQVGAPLLGVVFTRHRDYRMKRG